MQNKLDKGNRLFLLRLSRLLPWIWREWGWEEEVMLWWLPRNLPWSFLIWSDWIGWCSDRFEDLREIVTTAEEFKGATLLRSTTTQPLWLQFSLSNGFLYWCFSKQVIVLTCFDRQTQRFLAKIAGIKYVIPWCNLIIDNVKFKCSSLSAKASNSSAEGSTVIWSHASVSQPC